MHQVFKIRPLENRYPALHGLRVITILVAVHMHVMLHVALVAEVGKYQFSTDWMRFALNSGWQTMDFFFVLSGFLIGRILIEGQVAEGFSLKSAAIFYVKRGFRIFPLYYVTLFALWGIVRIWPIFSVNRVTQINWLPEIFYLSNYMRDQPVLAPWSWSLSLEEHLYLAAPFVVAAAFSIRSLSWRLGFVLAGAMIPLVLRYVIVERSVGLSAAVGPEAPPINIFKDLFIPTHLRFDTFLFGFIGALLHFERREGLERVFANPRFRALAWLAVASIYLYFVSPFFHRLPFMLPSYGVFLEPVELGTVARAAVWDFGFLSGLLYLLLILLLTTETGWLRKVLGHDFMRRVATLSYGVYLVHLPLAKFISTSLSKIYFFSELQASNQIAALAISSLFLTLVLSYLLSYGLHLMVEKPLLVVRDRMFS